MLPNRIEHSTYQPGVMSDDLRAFLDTIGTPYTKESISHGILPIKMMISTWFYKVGRDITIKKVAPNIYLFSLIENENTRQIMDLMRKLDYYYTDHISEIMENLDDKIGDEHFFWSFTNEKKYAFRIDEEGIVEDDGFLNDGSFIGVKLALILRVVAKKFDDKTKVISAINYNVVDILFEDGNDSYLSDVVVHVDMIDENAALREMVENNECSIGVTI